MKYIVVIPTYNEKENIDLLVKKILSQKILGLGIVFVDDNSPDGTGVAAEELAKKHRRKIFVIHRKGKLGLGTAYVEGWKRALKMGAGVIIGMDGDLSHDPRVIKKMIKVIKSCDMVIGSRHVKDGQIIGFDWFRKGLTMSAQMFSKWILGMGVYDSTSAFRAYTRETIELILSKRIRSTGYSFLIEVLYAVRKNGLKITEVPIVFGRRNSGKSKVSQKEIFKAVKTVIRLRLT